ncbi:MAG: PQQ-dependent sugar dehydrogenase [Methylococcaceae bacterium]
MKNFALFMIVLALLNACNSSPKETIEQDKDNAELKLPEGFSALVYADDLGNARHLTINDNGDVYVSLSRLKNNGGVVCLRDEDKNGRADLIKYTGKFEGTGIIIHDGYLYFGVDTMIVRYKLNPGEIMPSENYEVVAGGFDVQNQHAAKTFTFDKKENMYVNVGAPSNACQENDRTKGSPGMDPCPILELHGGIWRFKADQLNQDQAKDGYRFATGIRNAVAINWNNQEDKLYALQHGRDQLSQLYPQYYTDEQGAELPAEEFLLVDEGSNFGWPYCYYDGQQKKKVLGPEYGGDGKKVDRCTSSNDPIMAFPGHLAPNDVLFYTGDMFPAKYKNGAFIAFHGSWNRAPKPQEGFYVAFVPFKGSVPAGEWEIFASGFAGVDQVNSPNDAKHRPCGLAQAPDGSLFVSDDVKGRIYRIMYQ